MRQAFRNLTYGAFLVADQGVPASAPATKDQAALAYLARALNATGLLYVHLVDHSAMGGDQIEVGKGLQVHWSFHYRSSIGTSCPLRAIFRRTVVLMGPRIISSAWPRAMPWVATSSTCVMISLATTPVLAAGAPAP